MKFNKEDIVLFIKQNIKTIILAFLCSLVFIGGGVYYMSSSSEDDSEEFNIVTQKPLEEEASSNEAQNESKKIFVDVKGAVKKPGVYETTTEKRVKDIIDEAGGLLEDADTSNINLSQKLKDQMVVYILKNGEKPKQISNSSSASVGASGSSDEVININTASKEQLMKIPGVGKTKAEAIEAYREKNGDFKRKEDIIKVKGIGKATLEKIKDKIEV